MKHLVPLVMCSLLAVLFIQNGLPAQTNMSLESRVLDLEKKIIALEKKVKWNKDQIVRQHNLEVKSIDAVKWTKIKKGLSEEDVAGLIGKPKSRTSSRGATRWVYRYAEGTGYIVFKNGKVDSWKSPF